jgi:hypothetical protein
MGATYRNFAQWFSDPVYLVGKESGQISGLAYMGAWSSPTVASRAVTMMHHICPESKGLIHQDILN